MVERHFELKYLHRVPQSSDYAPSLSIEKSRKAQGIAKRFAVSIRCFVESLSYEARPRRLAVCQRQCSSLKLKSCCTWVSLIYGSWSKRWPPTDVTTITS